MTFRLGHSPDPDDAFMFYGMAKNMIDQRGYSFEHILQDIQTLNQRAMHGELEVSAISIHAFPHVADKYALMSCGSSMGDGYGPMVITTTPMTIADLKGKHIAIPGKMTTAFLTLQLLLGKAGEAFTYDVVMFDEIPAAIKAGKFDAGLIIHEGQLTYASMGLHLVVDLGVWWQEKTGLPLPLGGNVVRKDLGSETMREISRLLKLSIQYALDHRDEALQYALNYARDMDVTLADKFVGMYVNHWTLDYGERGRQAVRRLLDEAKNAGIIDRAVAIEFVE